MIIMSPHSNYSLNTIYKHFEGCSDFKFNQNGRFIPYNINIKNAAFSAIVSINITPSQYSLNLQIYDILPLKN